MAISNQTVLKKMSNEIQEAMLAHENDQQLREHIRSVRLLADLLLDENKLETKTSDRSVQEPTAEEVRQMMGTDKQSSSQTNKEAAIDHEEANGSSIFDF